MSATADFNSLRVLPARIRHQNRTINPASRQPSFAQRFQNLHGGTEMDFVRTALFKSLHSPFRWIAPLVFALFPRYFAAEFELIRYCGQLTKQRYLEAEISAYAADPQNHTLWRKWLRLRISTHRLRQLFKSTMRPPV